jgi:hypothetical protein
MRHWAARNFASAQKRLASVHTVIRVVSLCVVLAGVETLHGILRTVWLTPLVGKQRAIQLSIVSGMLLAFTVCYLLVPGIGLTGAGPLLALGAVIAAFMAGFDIALGRWLLHRSWPKVWADFNPATGNYLLIGVLLLVAMPNLVMWLRDTVATASP